MKEPRPLYCPGATVNMFFRSHFPQWEKIQWIDLTQLKLYDSSLIYAFIWVSLMTELFPYREERAFFRFKTLNAGFYINSTGSCSAIAPPEGGKRTRDRWRQTVPDVSGKEKNGTAPSPREYIYLFFVCHCGHRAVINEEPNNSL